MTSLVSFADPALGYHCHEGTTLSALAELTPLMSVACFADPALVYHRRERATPDAPLARIEPPVYHPVAIHQDQPVNGVENAGCATSRHRVDVPGVTVDGNRVVHRRLDAGQRGIGSGP